jgi:hypothetical protein
VPKVWDLISIFVLIQGILIGCSKENEQNHSDLIEDAYWDHKEYEKDKEETKQKVIASAAIPKESISIKVRNLNYDFEITEFIIVDGNTVFQMNISTNLPPKTEIKFIMRDKEGEGKFTGVSNTDANGNATVNMKYFNYSTEPPSGTYTLDAEMVALSFTDNEYDLWDAYGDAKSAEEFVGENGYVLPSDIDSGTSYSIVLEDFAKITYSDPDTREN